MSDVSRIFTCKRCGYCCQGETTVSLYENDRERMVASLGLPVEKVRAEYWKVTGETVQMKTVDGRCIFYKDGCTVHGGRPWRCGQWPLHPSILTDEMNFRTIAASCPGIKSELGYSRFCDILRELMGDSVLQC